MKRNNAYAKSEADRKLDFSISFAPSSYWIAYSSLGPSYCRIVCSFWCVVRASPSPERNYRNSRARCAQKQQSHAASPIVTAAAPALSWRRSSRTMVSYQNGYTASKTKMRPANGRWRYSRMRATRVANYYMRCSALPHSPKTSVPSYYNNYSSIGYPYKSINACRYPGGCAESASQLSSPNNYNAYSSSCARARSYSRKCRW